MKMHVKKVMMHDELVICLSLKAFTHDIVILSEKFPMPILVTPATATQ